MAIPATTHVPICFLRTSWILHAVRTLSSLVFLSDYRRPIPSFRCVPSASRHCLRVPTFLFRSLLLPRGSSRVICVCLSSTSGLLPGVYKCTSYS